MDVYKNMKRLLKESFVDGNQQISYRLRNLAIFINEHYDDFQKNNPDLLDTFTIESQNIAKNIEYSYNNSTDRDTQHEIKNFNEHKKTMNIVEKLVNRHKKLVSI